jgi:hypothetical protein
MLVHWWPFCCSETKSEFKTVWKIQFMPKKKEKSFSPSLSDFGLVAFSPSRRAVAQPARPSAAPAPQPERWCAGPHSLSHRHTGPALQRTSLPYFVNKVL